MKLNIPPSIRSRHPNAYLVGGSVRDLVRGVTPTDYDIAVLGDARGFADEIAKSLGTRVIPIGKGDFTVFRLVAQSTFIDISAAKGRDIEADLKARDFTINALACDLNHGAIVDVTGGLADLAKGVVRMVSPAVFVISRVTSPSGSSPSQ